MCHLPSRNQTWFAGKSSIYIVPGFLSGLPRLTTKGTSRLPDVSQCRLVPKSLLEISEQSATRFVGHLGVTNSEVPKSLENFAGVIAEERGVVMTHRSSVDEADGR